MARLHLPFEVLSDEHFTFAEALSLPAFVADGMRLIERMTLIARGGLMVHVFHPIAHPKKNASDTLEWLRANRIEVSKPLLSFTGGRQS